MAEEGLNQQNHHQVVLVAIKPDVSGKELLTWTLGKFVNAGDHVTALHITSSPSQADALSNTLDSQDREAHGPFHSIIDFYKDFHAIKQVEFQLEIICNSSLKRALVNESRKSKATKLILGYTAGKPPLRSSLSVAKYCSKKLPNSCSVVVIHRGQVAFERKGSSTCVDDDASRMMQTVQRTLRSRSWKSSSHLHSDSRRTSVSEEFDDSDVENEDFGNFLCRWPLQRFLELPINTYKCSSQTDNLKKINSMSSVSSQTSSPSFTVNSSPVRFTQETLLKDDKSTDIHQTESANFMEKDKQVSPVESTANKESSLQLTSIVEQTPENVENNGSDGDRPLAGWPLLRQSVFKNKPNHRPKMSVIEWTLQLPDRPREILNTYRNQPDIRCEDRFELYRTGENTINSSSPGSSDSTPSHVDRVASKIDRILYKNPCKQFHLRELQGATDNFSECKIVGKGGCSQVYQGILSDGSVVAVKCLNASAPNSEEEFLTEIEIISELDHSRIVHLIGYCISKQQYFLIYNFASEGNLEQRLHGTKGKCVMPWDARYKVAAGVAEALNYLHDSCKKPVIHRDVKSSNILLTSDLEPQLADFGLAKWASTASSQLTCSDVAGTFGYLAPEYFMFGKVSEKTDVYSFGVVLLELITGRRPIDNTNPKGEENLVIWGRPLLEDESNISKLVDPKMEGLFNIGQLKNMIVAASLCLRSSAQSRPRMSRILKLFTGDVEYLELDAGQDSSRKESEDTFDMPNYGESNIRAHLTLTLLGLDDDAASQGSIDNSVNLAHSNKYLEEYLCGRYSRSCSFE